MPRARVGVVLPVPATASAEIDGLRRAVGHGTVDRVGPHLTLIPPVNVPSGQLIAAIDVVRAAAARTPPLRLVLGPPATFWPATPVVYLEASGDIDGVHRLHDAVNQGAWLRPTTWPFVPHVTIAQDVDPDLIPASLAALAGYQKDVTLSSVQVLEENADRSWRPIADVTLAGRRVVARGGLEVVIEVGATLDREAAERLEAAWSDRVDGSITPLPSRRPFAVSARREGLVVGAAVGRTDDELWLDRIAVDAAARGQGVGRHLLRAVEALGSERGCDRAFVVCEAGSGLRAWYEAKGWSEDIALPGWRHGRTFVRMRRELPAVSPRR